MAVCLLEIGTSEQEKKDAVKVLAKVPSLRQKIAGKSIPLEVSLFTISLSFFRFLYHPKK